MFMILNRLRGTWGIMAKVTGAALGALFYLFTYDLYTSFLISVAYVVGESFGWGKWIGGIINGNKVATKSDLEEAEGESNGIHFLANWIAPQTDNYQHYCITALSIRGFYWAALTILPLLIFGYIGYWTFFTTSLLLGVAFPISVIIGKYTAKKFTYEYKFFSMKGSWEHGEVWYGVIQDIVLILFIVSKLL